MDSLTINRALLQTLLTTSSTTKSEAAQLCAHLSRVDAFLVGWWELCAYAPSNPEQFNFVVLCPTDAIAVALNNSLILNLETLSSAIPAVEIWIKGPGYGVILPLLPAIMLSCHEESLGRNMTTTSVLDRVSESTALLNEDLRSSQTSEIVWLENLARKLNKTNEEMIGIVGIAGFPMFPTPEKRIFLREKDVPEIISRWLAAPEDTESVPENMESAGAPSDAGRRSRKTSPKETASSVPTKMRDLEATDTSTDPPVIKYKPGLRSTDIKADAKETFQRVIPKIEGHPRFIVVKAIAGSTKIGEKILSDIEQKFVKNFPNGRVNLFLKNFKQCAIDEVNNSETSIESTEASAVA